MAKLILPEERQLFSKAMNISQEYLMLYEMHAESAQLHDNICEYLKVKHPKEKETIDEIDDGPDPEEFNSENESNRYYACTCADAVFLCFCDLVSSYEKKTIELFSRVLQSEAVSKSIFGKYYPNPKPIDTDEFLEFLCERIDDVIFTDDMPDIVFEAIKAWQDN
ncbi:MAG TPA: hypothetical protein VN426_15875 [Syntrophomonadaceae bacterium]|nr:hypothetical protein [Syntrophomonadaceae bacterium]